MGAFGKEYRSWMLVESASQSVFYQVLNAFSGGVFKENV